MASPGRHRAGLFFAENEARVMNQCACVDLRPWAKTNRYRWRFEESYKAETDAATRGDGRWYVEVLCRNGLIYPCGGVMLLAYAKSGVVSRVADVVLHQTDGGARVFKFPVERLDEVAAILKPRRRRTYSPKQIEVMAERLAGARERKKSLAQSGQTGAYRVGLRESCPEAT